MQLSNQISLSDVPWNHPPEHIALRGDYLSALGSDGTLVVLRLLAGGATELIASCRVEQRGPIQISPSGRYLILRDATATRQITIWDMQRNVSAAVFGDKGERPYSATATFALFEQREVLLVSQRRFQLSAHDLADMDLLFEVSSGFPYGFSISNITALDEQHTLFVSGHQEGESRNALLRLSWRELREDISHFLDSINNRSHFYDYSYNVLAGPCAGQSVAIVRDPEEDEDPGYYDDNDFMQPIEGFKGIYVRSLQDNQVVDTVALDNVRVPPESAYRYGLYGNHTQLCLLSPDRIAMLPRTGQESVKHATIPAQATSLDPSRGRIAAVLSDGAIVLIELGS